MFMFGLKTVYGENESGEVTTRHEYEKPTPDLLKDDHLTDG